MPSAPPVTVGVDGFRRGWVAAIRRGQALAIETAPDMEGLVDRLPADAVIVVDMPIGLPERISGVGRIAEQAASAMLRKRRSSLFPMPARAVVEAFGERTLGLGAILAAHQKASNLARATSDPPRGLALQGFSILPRVAEIDRLLRARPVLAERLVEGHPEVAFADLNGGREMGHAKKSAAGQAERRTVLLACGLPEGIVQDRLRGIPEDDRLDALAMLLVADRHAAGLSRPLPDPPGRDAHGLPIAIRV